MVFERFSFFALKVPYQTKRGTVSRHLYKFALLEYSPFEWEKECLEIFFKSAFPKKLLIILGFGADLEEHATHSLYWQ